MIEIQIFLIELLQIADVVTPRQNFIVNICVQVVNYYLSHLLSKINGRIFNKHIILYNAIE